MSESTSNNRSTSFKIAKVFQGVKNYLGNGSKERTERLETDDMSEKSIDSQEELIVVQQPERSARTKLSSASKLNPINESGQKRDQEMYRHDNVTENLTVETIPNEDAAESSS